MLVNTRAVIDSLICEVKRFHYIVGIVMNLFYVLTPLYAIFTEKGHIAVNIALCVMAVGYNIYHILTESDKARKKEKREVKRIYTLCRLLANTVTLGIVLYGFFISSESLSFFSLVFAVMSLIGWLFGIITYLIFEFFENRKELLLSAIYTDFKPITASVNAVNSIVGKIKGEEKTEATIKVSEKAKNKLDKLRHRFVEKKNRKKEEKRLAERQKKEERETANK